MAVTPITRKQIAAFVGGDPETVRAIEALFRDVQQGIPADVTALAAQIVALTAEVDENAASIVDGQVTGATTGARVEALAGALHELAKAIEGLSIRPRTEHANAARLDYLDWNRVGPHVSQGLRMQWNDDDGTIDVGLNDNVMLQVGQEILFFAKNTSGGTIANGTPVMFNGTVGASAKLEFTEAVADGSSPPEYMMGVTTEEIANNGWGYVTSFGIVRGFNTSGTPYGETWADGDILYFSGTGQWTKTRPAAPALDLPVAVVLNAATGGSGSIFVRMKTGQRVQDIHDVEAAAPSAGDVLIYDDTQGRWEANGLTAAGGVSITPADGAITIGTTGATGSFTAASGETVTVSNGIITSIV
jgi:hypothetical protein